MAEDLMIIHLETVCCLLTPWFH